MLNFMQKSNENVNQCKKMKGNRKKRKSRKARKQKAIVLYTITNMCTIVMHSYDELDITFAIFNVTSSSSKYLH